jgi:hypothetical protein
MTSEFQLKHTCLSIHYYNKMEQGPRTLQLSNLKTTQHDKVTGNYSARRRANKLTTLNISKITP